MPLIPKNIGRVSISGKKNINWRVMAINTPLNALPIDVKKLPHNGCMPLMNARTRYILKKRSANSKYKSLPSPKMLMS